MLDPDLQMVVDLMTFAFNMLYEMREGFSYEPTHEESIAGLAEKAGIRLRGSDAQRGQWIHLLPLAQLG